MSTVFGEWEQRLGEWLCGRGMGRSCGARKKVVFY